LTSRESSTHTLLYVATATESSADSAAPSASNPSEDGANFLLCQIAENSPHVNVVVTGPEFRILYANRAAHRAVLGGAGDLVGKIATQAFAFIDPVRLVSEPNVSTLCRAVPERRGVETVWWDVSYTAMAASTAESAGVLVTAVDVTHHEIARVEAEAAKVTLDALLAYIPLGISISHGPEVCIDRISAWGMALIGRQENELVGRKALEQTDVWEVYSPGSDSPLPPVDRPLARATLTGEMRMNETLIIRCANGTALTVLCNSGPIRDRDGRITGALMAWQDTSELERANAALRASDERLRAVLLQIPAAVLVVEAPDGRVSFQSELVEDLLGHPEYDLAAARISLHGWAVHEDGRPYDLMEYPSRRALFFGETVQGEKMKYRRGDGRLIDLEMHAGPVRDQTGKIVAAVAVALDVTERQLADSRLRDSEQRLRLVMDATKLGMWEYDATTGTILSAARHDEIFGYSAPQTEWSLQRFMDHFHELDRERVEANVRAALDAGKEFDEEYRIIRADGSRGWSKVCARPQLSRNGTITCLLGSIEDISERKEAESAAIETGAKFENLARAMPSMVWTSLPDGRIDWFNDRVSEYSGIPAAQMKPDGWSPVHPDDVEHSTSRYVEAITSGTPYVCEYRIRRHDGQYRWHITRAVPIRDSSGAITLWIGTSADIQDQKNTEHALADLNTTLEQQVRQRTAELLVAEAALRQSQKMDAIGQLTGGLAHDFNNLLTGITGSLEFMAVRLSQGRVTDFDRHLRVAREAAKRAAALTHRLLAFARRQTLDPKPTDVNQLVNELGDLIRRTVGPAVEVSILDMPSLWWILVDPNQLESALLNLCINARDAMPDGGKLTIETDNRTLLEGEARELELQSMEYVLLCVSDTGGGMTPAVIERAFDPFFTTKPLGAGTGLGLSMVYGFVRQSGGQARIQSAPGKGTSVLLYLPRHLGKEEALEHSLGAQRSPRGGGETVLVVDDEASVRALVSEVLTELGYSVLQAEHGAAGLKLLEATDRVDLLVTDVGLPGGMNGRQLADAARVTRPNLKVLFITGYAENAVIGGGRLELGMHLLTKPFTLETLAARIKEIIAAEQ
jgi:PAS domain S-box-containing protein